MSKSLSFLLITVIIIVAACQNKPQEDTGEFVSSESYAEFTSTALEKLVDSFGLKGSVLVHMPDDNMFASNNYEWARTGRLPASTFKIPNSIIGLEVGVLEDENSIFTWDGEKKRIKSWEQDLTLKQAFAVSCLPCYRELARKVGLERMQAEINTIEYPGMLIDSGNLDLFWVQGLSQINQFEQIEFIKKLNTEKLKIKDNTYAVMKNIMLRDSTEEYQVYAKTGMYEEQGTYNGWYVGYIETKNGTFYFATNVEAAEEMEFNVLAKSRIDLTIAALKSLNIIE